ncbi:MAG TPA: S41 family peptidase [Gammaproteobacteria bacterium]
MSPFWRTLGMPGFVVLLAIASPAFAGSEPLAPAVRETALHAIEAAIRKDYVFPELKAPLVAKLEQADAAHRYDGDDADTFSQHVTEDLQAVAHDGHLYLDSDPDEYAAERAPPKSDKGMDAYYRAVAIRENSGLTDLRILPGNIRYLKLTAFHWTAGLTPKAYDDAGRFLKYGDAIIVDLRGNGGGDSDAGDYFPKAFVTPNKGKPFYILVDGHVASAGEAVPYGLQQEKAAVIVGSTTYGAANNNKKFPIPPQFILSVSYHRPINPISHSNWEGIGVVPDIAVPGSQALPAAELDALEKLAARPGLKPGRLAEYAWSRAGVEAELHPAALSREQLQGYAGTYGPIILRLAPDGLRLSRSDRPRWQQDLLLTPMTADGLFSVESFDDLRVRITAASLDLLHGSDDARESFPRDPHD